MNVGFKIKALREGKNLSKEQMSDYLQMSLNTYKKIEYGEKIPTLNEIKIISHVLEVDPIIFLKDESTDNLNSHNHIIELSNAISKLSESLLMIASYLNKRGYK